MKNILLLTIASIFCCPSYSAENQSLSWLDDLKQNLPQPPICGSDAQDKIFGGYETAINEHPWLVRLEYLKSDKSTKVHCHGTLINERYVLTGAVCVKRMDAKSKLVNAIFGEWNTNTEVDCSPDDASYCAPSVQKISIAEAITHMDYRVQSKNHYNDIALLRLAEKVEFNDFVKPLCLPTDPSLWSKDYSEHTFEVAGKTEDMTESMIKRTVTLPFIPNDKCSIVLKKFDKTLIDTQVCAGGDQGKDACNGDSGAPLMKYNVDNDLPYWVQIGIVSYGFRRCGLKDFPGVYTRVSSFMKWIAETIQP